MHIIQFIGILQEFIRVDCVRQVPFSQRRGKMPTDKLLEGTRLIGSYNLGCSIKLLTALLEILLTLRKLSSDEQGFLFQLVYFPPSIDLPTPGVLVGFLH